MNMEIDLNDQFRRALDLMEDGRRNVFITGKAGTGKSTLLKYFRQTTKNRIAVLAPTGVAAVNIQGQTLHSFFGFKPDITLGKIKKSAYIDYELYNALDAIVIDEISMVRADLLDCVDKFLRLVLAKNKPFGGLQMIFIGDLYQLPPVVTGKERELFRSHYKSQYFFDSAAFNGIEMEFIELEKIYRQKDEEFIRILNAVRNNTVTDKEVCAINRRLAPDFRPGKNRFYITLTTTNVLADEVNEKELSNISAKEFHYTGKIKGNFDRSSLPTETDLKVKVGAQIMLLNNDPNGRWINGSVGKIIDIRRNGKKDTILAELRDGRTVDVEPYTWKMFNMVYNKDTKTIDSETTGSFTQYPIRLAWAVTIHKSQGKTFDNVIIDLGKGTFSHGQVYVALSRCTSMDGIVLKKPLSKKHIFMDWKIVKFLTSYQYSISEKKLSISDKVKIIEDAIKNKTRLSIVYLKSNDEKSKRIVQPKTVGKMQYNGKEFVGVEAYCFSRKDDRVFRVDRILEMKGV